MTTMPQADSMHRLVKHAMDSGAATSITEAEAIFRGYRLSVEIAATEVADPVAQATLLTLVTVARRVFLGGVNVAGDLDADLAVPLPLGRTLAEAIEALGARSGIAAEQAPTVVVGGGPAARREGFCVRTAAGGWRGGVLPVHSEVEPVPGPPMPLAGMLAAALAVSEAFLFVNSGLPVAGRRVLGLSLWKPDVAVDWLVDDSGEPPLAYFPAKLWLIGLGHLGQAYLWGLGLLPYLRPEEVSLVLQDIDVVTTSTESTSVLTDGELIGQKKTRTMATWAERRGFVTSIQERRFDADFRRQESEPCVALCGLDNPEGRRVLDQVGFDLVIEAGLGRGHRDFRTMRLHTLPGSRPAAELWKETTAEEAIEDRPAYSQLKEEGLLDRCGITLLAGKAVGAPFVGAVAATLALSEILRLLHCGSLHEMINLDLLSLDQRVVAPNPRDFSYLNPGFTLPKSPSS